jgi:hypothetical protein
MSLEIRKLLVLSTAHLTAQTIARLSVDPIDKWPVFGGPLPFGFLVYAHEENGGAGAGEIPADLFACCLFAHEKGLNYLMFDADAAEVEGLPVHDHAALTQEIERLKREAAAPAAVRLTDLRDAEGEGRDYRVTWEIDLFDQTSPRGAAAAARLVQLDPAALAGSFTVTDAATGEAVQVDLDDAEGGDGYDLDAGEAAYDEVAALMKPHGDPLNDSET